MNFWPDFGTIHSAFENEGSREMPVAVQMLIDSLTSQGILIRDTDIQSLCPKATPHAIGYHLSYHNY